jgi:Leucine-rich repeat (LRR) protein
MRLTEVPPELFRLKHAKKLLLFNNNLCSLPSDIAHLVNLEWILVRRSQGF